MLSIHLHLVVPTAQGETAGVQQIRCRQMLPNSHLVFSRFLPPTEVYKWESFGQHWSPKAISDPSDLSPSPVPPRCGIGSRESNA